MPLRWHVIGRRVERRRAVERGNQLRAVVERHAIAATSDTVNTRAARACRAPRPGSRREGTAPGQTARPRRARCNRLMAGRFAIAALSARRRRIIGNLVKSRHNSSNLGKSWRMTGIAAGLPSFAKICMGVRWQDRHCYVAMRGLLASGSTLGAGLGTARDGRGRRGPRCRAAVEPRADRQRGGSRARAPHVGRTGRAWAGCPDGPMHRWCRRNRSRRDDVARRRAESTTHALVHADTSNCRTTVAPLSVDRRPTVASGASHAPRIRPIELALTGRRDHRQKRPIKMVFDL